MDESQLDGDVTYSTQQMNSQRKSMTPKPAPSPTTSSSSTEPAASTPGSSSTRDITGDLWGGFAAMLVALPSAIAFGVTIFSPLGAEFGAKGALAGMLGVAALGLVAATFGGTQRLISAPCAPAAAVLSALSIQMIQKGSSPSLVILSLFLVAFCSSIFQILFGVLRIGRIMRFMPYTVVSGYLSGVGLIVIFSQIPKWLATPKGTNWFHSLIEPEIWHLPSLIIGLSTMVFTVVGPKLTKRVPAVILGLAGGVVAYWALALGAYPELLSLENNDFVIGHLQADLGGIVQSISAPWSSISSEHLPALEGILVPAITLAVLLSIDTLKTCLVLDAITGTRHNSNQELIGQGLGNLTSTLIGGSPGAGTMGATLVNKASGGNSYLSGVFQGIWSLLAIVVLTPLIAWVPTSCLGALLIVIGYKMIDWHSFQLIRSKDTILDFLVIASVVLVANTLSLIAASGFGVAMAILLFIREQIHSSNIRRISHGDQSFSKRLRTHEERAILIKNGKRTVIFELQGSLFFGTTDQLLLAIEEETASAKFVLLDFYRVESLDFTAGHMIERIQEKLEARGAYLILSRMPEKTVTGRDLKTYINHVGLKGSKHTLIVDDLSAGLEWIEDHVIEKNGLTHPVQERLKLEEFELFSGLDPEEIQMIKNIAVERHVQASEVVFAENEVSSKLVLIAKGEVKIHLNVSETHQMHISTLGRGQIFGEISFIDAQKHSAQTSASKDSDLIILEKTDFEALCKDHPHLQALMIKQISKDLAARLRNKNEELRALIEK